MSVFNLLHVYVKLCCGLWLFDTYDERVRFIICSPFSKVTVRRINMQRICDCGIKALWAIDNFMKDDGRKLSITREKLITLRFQLERWWRDLVRIFTEGGKLDFMGEAHSNETSIFNDLLWPIAFSPAVAILWLILEAGILSYWLANKMCLATGKE